MKCSYIKNDGNGCKANAINNSKYCYFHDENTSSDRYKSQSLGGKAASSKVIPSFPPRKIREASDITELLEETINLVREGKIDVKAANCIGILSGQLLKAIETTNVANRVEAIERIILERKTIKN